jgi:hypothetical protein
MWRLVTLMVVSRSILLTMRNVLDKICIENQNTHCMFNNFFSPKIVPLLDNGEKRCRAGQDTDDNRMHDGYLRLHTHTHRICNAHCFSTVTMVAGTRLDVTLYVHCMSCYNHYDVLCNVTYDAGYLRGGIQNFRDWYRHLYSSCGSGNRR